MTDTSTSPATNWFTDGYFTKIAAIRLCLVLFWCLVGIEHQIQTATTYHPKPRIETSKARHTRINGQDVIEVTATVANDGETGPISVHARVFTDKGRWEQRDTVVLVSYRTADFRFLFFDVQGTAPRFSLFFNSQSGILSDPVP